MVENKLKLVNHSKPDRLDISKRQKLVSMSQQAFPVKGTPTRKEALDHITNTSSITTAEDGKGEPIGYCSLRDLEFHGQKFILHHGVIVDKKYRGLGLGTLLLDLAVLRNMENDQVWVGGRTQNVFYLKYIEDLRGYPQKDRKMPSISESQKLKCLADYYISRRDQARYRQPILENAYSKPLFRHSNGIEDYLSGSFMLERGDAVLAVANVSRRALRKRVEESKSRADIAISERKKENG